jgi:alkylated DNA repair protein alkB family protein 7
LCRAVSHTYLVSVRLFVALQSKANSCNFQFIRRRYEKGHWDAVIIKYKETELSDESSLSLDSQSILNRIREQLLQCHFDDDRKKQVTWLPCHAIDLHPDGALNAHVDSVRFSGDIVGGLSLLSPSIMRLKPEAEGESGHVDLFLPPLSLYVLSGPSRFSYTHELLPTGDTFNGVAVEREHRLSVIFRDAKVGNEED